MREKKSPDGRGDAARYLGGWYTLIFVTVKCRKPIFWSKVLILWLKYRKMLPVCHKSGRK